VIVNALDELKSRQQKAWGAGDYARIAQKLVKIDAQAQVKQGLIGAIHKFNRADDGTLVLPLNYVEVVAVKR
jgi:hypothetical protein